MNDQVNQGDQGQVSLGWRAALPDDLKEHDFVKMFQKPGDFARAAIELKTERDSLKARLEDSIPKLPDDASPEEKMVFYRSIGAPDSPEGYAFEGGTMDEEMTRWARKAFYESGLTKDQASALVKKFSDHIASLVQKQEKAEKEARDAVELKMKAEYGAKYAENVELAKRFWKKYSGEDFDAFVDSHGLGNDPRFVRFVFEVARRTGEDGSMKSSPAQEKKEVIPGLVYDKSPTPPKRT